MKVAILGSGFGLYGYLPAIVCGCGQQVLLPERYRGRLAGRADVAELADRVEWAPHEDAMLDAADALIIAQRPDDQVKWIGKSLRRPNIRRFLLEKPVAPTPAAALALLDEIRRRGAIVRIAYTFRYTQWARRLFSKYRDNDFDGPVEIEWLFRAHHYKINAQVWKRFASQGGGAIRFFGIHLIALLAEMGYEAASNSEVAADKADEVERWRATFTGPGLPDARIHIDSNAASERFAVGMGQEHLHLGDSFQDAPAHDRLDRRVSGLTALCREFLEGNEGVLPWYQNSIELWAKVENMTRQLSGPDS